MTTLDEQLRRLAERGHHRGADEVFRAASDRASTRLASRPGRLLAAAAVLAALATGAGMLVSERSDDTTVAAPDRARVDDPPAVSEGVGGSVPAATTPGAPAATGDLPSDTGDGVAPLGDGPAVPVELRSHASCGSVLDHLKALGTEAVGPYGFEGARYAPTAGTAAADAQDSAAPAAGPGEGSEHSRSNVQEPGLDEADVVKTDGRLVVAVARGQLQIVSVADRTLLSSTELAAGPGPFFLLGDTVAVIGPPRWEDDSTGPQTPVTLLDIADPRAPHVRAVTWIEGVIRTSRQQDGVLRLVTADDPDFSWTTPTDDSPEARARAEDRNRELIERSSLETWLPTYRTLDAAGEPVAGGTAASCRSAYTTSEPSGFDTTTVVTLDPATGVLHPGTSVSATPLTVYASSRSLYVVSTVCCTSSPEELHADVHRFDLTDRTAAPHRSSGSVRGAPVDQFALSERDGHLRIATTYVTQDDTGARDTDSAVWVLAERGTELELLGSVTGLGRTGETIHSVRYQDAYAYVVTFRRTDPLHVVDLTDPTNPTLVGELHVPGFSTYLQPLGSGRLLGVGRDADEEGRTGGLQLSLFDVAEPAAPSRADVLTYDRAGSPAEHDHLAVLHWAPEDLVVVPIFDHDDSEPCSLFAGALLLRAAGRDLEEISRVSHADHAAEGEGDAVVPIMRSAVAGGRLLTVSDIGVAFGALDDGQEEDFVRFEGAAPTVERMACHPEPRPAPGEEEPDDDPDGGVPLPLG